MRSRALLAAALLCTLPFGVAMTCGSSEPTGSELFATPQVDPIALSPDGAFLYVVNTPAAALEIFHVASGARNGFVPVGIGPAGLGVRPDGREVWVANHISDSVSVVDTDPTSASYLQVVETIQAVDASLVTLFDEPVDVAFASNGKAYVSLSSRNQIAVIDATTYTVTDFLPISAQEPRAMRVANGKLFVTVLESGNQSELSSCPSQIFFPPTAQCTFDLIQANFAQNPQFVGFDADIVIDPDVPDRDLFVFDTTTDAQVDVVSGVGTLLYGVAADDAGNVFVAMTDARNAENGRAGTAGEGLADLDNRMFLNQVGRVDCSSVPCGAATAVDLEPLPPTHPAPGTQLATPYGVQVSGDGALLVGTAASSSRIFTYDTATNTVVGRLDVGAIPRGVALLSDGSGVAQTAFVLNALESSIDVVDVTNPAAPVSTRRLTLSTDPTPDPIRRGRIAFNSAEGSSNGTFSCASCHPDGHVDQLLWVIGAECTFAGCDQEEARSTMPIKGLQDTLPLHWDGVLGDPFGGANGEVGANGSAPANCGNEHECFRHLVNAALGGVMCDPDNCTSANELSLAGQFSEAERDDMAEFLKSVSYEPARSRRPDDVVTQQAIDGFEQFFTDVGGNGLAGPETCADAPGGCHALPHGTGTNAFFVGGMDAPTMRGITDRFLLFSAGVTLVEEQLLFSDPSFVAYQPNVSDVDWLPDTVGFDELTSWAQAFGTVQAPGAFRDVYNADTFDVFQMTEEAANGHSGALGRQVTLNTRTANDAGLLAEIQATLAILEAADGDGKVVLTGKGRRAGNGATYSFDAGLYHAGTLSQTRAELVAEAAAGTTLVTFTARLPANVTSAVPQPGLAVPAVSARTGLPGTLFDGRPDLPTTNPMQIDGLHIEANPTILVDGQVAAGSVTCLGGSFSPTCDSSRVQVDLSSPPTSTGIHLLQLQNPAGLTSNEMPFVVP